MNLLRPMDPPPPSTRAEMPCIPVHTTVANEPYFRQMDPPVPGQRCLEYHYTKLGRWTLFSQWTPLYQTEMPWIPVHKTWQMNLLWPLEPPVSEQRWLAYHSSIHHIWDTPHHFLKTHFSLESDFLSFLELQKSLLVSFQGCWIQWQMFESSSTHCCWDTPLHFLKTCFSLECGFLVFLDLQ